jgi:phosphoenolpyruvate-protein phosphotransferase (PTS system enzyme I)
MSVMIEVPAAALAADEIARHVDFVSVGTNDLLLYLNAADRQLGALAEFQDPFAPTVLKMLCGIRASARATRPGSASAGQPPVTLPSSCR